MQNLSCTREDYLRALLALDSGYGVHSVDIANKLKVSRASVSKMMKTLKEEGFISKEKYSLVQLTEKGKKAAQHIDKKYKLLRNFFQNYLGIDERTAQEEACAVEHCISLKTLEIIYTKLKMC